MHLLSQELFLGATKHLYNWLCPPVCRSVTHSFDDPQVAPIGLLGLVILKGAPAVSESEKAVEEVYDLLRNLPKYKAEILKEAIDGKFL